VVVVDVHVTDGDGVGAADFQFALLASPEKPDLELLASCDL
jgi:hypothetical protein